MFKSHNLTYISMPCCGHLVTGDLNGSFRFGVEFLIISKNIYGVSSLSARCCVNKNVY